MRLASLRRAIKNKRNNITDLENILEEDKKRLRSFPIYCWILLFIHLGFMLNSWATSRGVMFTVNFVMYHWYVKKYFNEITMWIAVPMSVLIMMVWAVN
jgi:hypothetical protein